jgi:hypothetical protein
VYEVSPAPPRSASGSGLRWNWPPRDPRAPYIRSRTEDRTSGRITPGRSDRCGSRYLKARPVALQLLRKVCIDFSRPHVNLRKEIVLKEECF